MENFVITNSVGKDCIMKKAYGVFMSVIGHRGDANLHNTNGVHTGNPIKKVLWNALFVLFVLSLIVRLTQQVLTTYGCESWWISEFLINYQGGFVRRGLMGEILFFFAKNYNIDIEWTIKIFCLVCVIAVSTFFIKAFMNKGYTLYILPLCFFLGNGIFHHDWIRKDYLFFCFFIPILWLYNKDKWHTSIRIISINFLVVFIMLSHEVFAFFSLPLLFLLFFDKYKNPGIFRSVFRSLMCLSPSLCAFFLCLIYHGTPETAQVIWDSWMPLLDQTTSDTSVIGDSVAAIGWSSTYIIRMHGGKNFLSMDQQICSSLVWMITFPTVYYITTNALLVFRNRENDFTDRHKSVLSSVLIFQLFCLSPVFMILSCDYIRLFFYWIASSFAVFLLLPIDKFETLFPVFITHIAERINKVLTDILPPSKTLLALLMLFMGISPVGFRVVWAFQTTMLCHILVLLSLPFELIRMVLFVWFGVVPG